MKALGFFKKLGGGSDTDSPKAAAKAPAAIAPEAIAESSGSATPRVNQKQETPKLKLNELALRRGGGKVVSRSRPVIIVTFMAWRSYVRMSKMKQNIAEKKIEYKRETLIRRVLLKWFQECNRPCPMLGFDHVDPVVRVDAINAFLKRRSDERLVMLARIMLTEWRVYAQTRSQVTERIAEKSSTMITDREKRALSLNFNNWLRLLDDRRMMKAADRIRKDGDKIAVTEHNLIWEKSRSERIIDMLDGVLVYTQKEAMVGKSFYHWLIKCRKLRLQKPVAIPVQEQQTSGRFYKKSGTGILDSLHKTSPIVAGSALPPQDTLMPPAWPSGFDIVPQSLMTLEESKLPPITPLYSTKIPGVTEADERATNSSGGRAASRRSKPSEVKSISRRSSGSVGTANLNSIPDADSKSVSSATKTESKPELPTFIPSSAALTDPAGSPQANQLLSRTFRSQVLVR